MSVMIDPWRNHPSRTWDWYFHDFPITLVDVGVSTHAHFDHDALHRLDAHVLLDRLNGMYRFGDMQLITAVPFMILNKSIKCFMELMLMGEITPARGAIA
jgi:hypothetical protein